MVDKTHNLGFICIFCYKLPPQVSTEHAQSVCVQAATGTLTGLVLALRHSVCVQELHGALGGHAQVLRAPLRVQGAFRLQQTQGNLTHQHSCTQAERGRVRHTQNGVQL